MSAFTSALVPAVEKRYSICVTSGVAGARSAAISAGTTQPCAVSVIDVAKPTTVRCGDPGTPVTVICVPMPIDGPIRMSFSTTCPGCVAQWPDSRVRSSTGPSGEERPTMVSYSWKTPPGGPEWPGGGVTGMFAVTVVSGNGPAAAVTPGSRVVAASWADEALVVAVTSDAPSAANAWSNGAFESTSRPSASVEAAVDPRTTTPITTACPRRPP